MLNIMTPGPTKVRENVRLARSLETTNPDLDPAFFAQYKRVCNKVKSLLHAHISEAYLLSGEGILGLEAACASLTEPGDRVLILDNGIFGKGFADFVTLYGGKPVLYTTDYQSPIDVAALKEFLEKDHDYQYATIVHCDTPSGVLNDISQICPLLSQYGILSVVDSVSASFGEEVRVDDWHVDVLCGGSQKVISAPPGLTLVTVSPEAFNAMKERKTPIASFYANLLIWEGYDEKQWFPYTPPISDILGLEAALDNIQADPEILTRHAQIAAATRKAVTKAGLSLYLNAGFSNTVTVINVPQGTTDAQILSAMTNEHNIMIAGCFDVLAGKVIRIGHMGENANVQDVSATLDALDKVLTSLGVNLSCKMKDTFLTELT